MNPPERSPQPASLPKASPSSGSMSAVAATPPGVALPARDSEKSKVASARTTASLGSRLTPSASGERLSLAPEEAGSSSSGLFAAGAIIADKYLVDGILGEGGLGVVVSATHLHLDQKVAIKYLRGSAPRDRTVVDRFLREARLAAQIKSDHVVRVFDVATLSDGTPYMVMEQLEGTDLRALLEERVALPLDMAIDLVLQACEAVAEAHAQGIVHRDLKPDNLFLSRRNGRKDVLKILDFGISKLSDRYTSSSRVNVVTQAGDRLGTPLYMSPEQLEGDPNTDARTDIWALGVVLYELFTGTMPFTGDSLPALCTAVLTKTPVPVTTLRRGLSEKMDSVISRCLAKSRDDRYANVAELAQELGAFTPPVARARVGQIVRTVLESGETIRPPRWDHADAPTPVDKLVSVPPASMTPDVVPRRSLAPWAAGLLVGSVVIAWTAHRFVGSSGTESVTGAASTTAAASPVSAGGTASRLPARAEAPELPGVAAPSTGLPAAPSVPPTETAATDEGSRPRDSARASAFAPPTPLAPAAPAASSASGSAAAWRASHPTSAATGAGVTGGGRGLGNDRPSPSPSSAGTASARPTPPPAPASSDTSGVLDPFQ